MKIAKGILGGLGILFIIGGSGYFTPYMQRPKHLGLISIFCGIILLPIPTFEKKTGERPVLIIKVVIMLVSLFLMGTIPLYVK